MAEADRRAIAAGTPESVLVERSGRAVAQDARRLLGGCYGRRAVVVAGSGNNGADGAVAARVLEGWGVRVELFELAAGLDRDVARRAIERADLVVDAMFGTGFRGSLEGDAAWIAEELRSRGAVVLAVDVPSGVDGLTGRVRGEVVGATATTCLAALKPGLLFEPGRTHAGAVRVADIGVDVADCGTPGRALVRCIEQVDAARAVRRNPRRWDAGANKWSAAVLVVGGSRGMTGAPMLAAGAAARTGAGMVVVGVPGDAAASDASGSELVVRALPATDAGGLAEDAGRIVVRDLAARFGAIVVGPGLGRDERTFAAVRRVVAEAPCALVLDADALVALSDDPAPLRVRHAAGTARTVLTPHAREYERLAGERLGPDRIEAAALLAERTNAVVLLKGPGTVIAEPRGRVAVCPIGGAELAAAGTGDVLAGIVAAILAFGADPFEAAAAGAWLQARAATRAGTGASLVAGDLVSALGPTLARLSRSDLPED